MPDPSLPLFLTVKLIAEILGVRTHAVTALIARGDLPASDISLKGSKPRWRIRREDFESWLERRKAKPPAPRRRRSAQKPLLNPYY